MKLFNLTNGKSSNQIELSEIELSNLLQSNWRKLFPKFILIKREFYLKGEVRNHNSGGRIDFLAYNEKNSSFVVIEVKKNYDKNVRNQIFDYVDFIEDNFEYVFLKSKELIELPDFKNINKKVELVLISKKFKTADHVKIKRIDYPISLIEYNYFENNNLLIELYTNQNSQIKTQKIETKVKQEVEIDNYLHQFWEIFFELIQKEVIFEEIDYKNDGVDIIFRLNRIHEHYRMHCIGLQIRPASLTVIRNLLVISDFYKGKCSSRFINEITNKQFVTSGYKFDYLGLRKIYTN